MVLDLKNPTPREEELLQPNDQALDMYEVLDDKAFENIKNLEYAFQAWSRLEEACDDTSINSFFECTISQMLSNMKTTPLALS